MPPGSEPGVSVALTLGPRLSHCGQLLKTPMRVKVVLTVALPCAVMAAQVFWLGGPVRSTTRPSIVAEPCRKRPMLAIVAAPGFVARKVTPSGTPTLKPLLGSGVYTPSASASVEPAGAFVSALPIERHGAATVQGLASLPLTGSTKRSAAAARLTIVAALTEPAALVAVSVKVVLAETLTALLVRPVTSPIPLSIDSVVAPADSQLSVTLPPAIGRDAGVAVKDEIVGALAVTVSVAALLVCLLYTS